MKRTRNSRLTLFRNLKIVEYIPLQILIFTLVSCSNTKIINYGYNEYLDVKPPKTAITYPEIDSLYIYPLLFTHNFEDTLLSKQLIDFYKKRNFKAAWHGKEEYSGRLREQLINTIKYAEYEGLNSEDYYYLDILRTIHNIDALQKQELSFPQLNAKLDILLTKAFLKYASHLYSGTINPANVDKNWEYVYKHKDFNEILELAIRNNNLKPAFELLYPKSEQYYKLRSALIELIKLKKTTPWQMPDFGTTLRLNDTSQNVLMVRSFLETTGDFQHNDNKNIENPFVYDNELELSVKNFQTRHGLKPDGVIGENTRLEMTKNLDFRINQIKVNMERLRWSPDTYGEKFIIVNLPEYTLRYYENDSLVEKMKVIIGGEENHTPILNDTIIYVEFNPSWSVPYSIASKEILPKIKKDSNYLARNNYQLVKGYAGNRKVVDPKTVDWKHISEENFPFHIIQAPGPTNALGLVKFIFPNSHAVYLHDTPSDYLFNSYERDLSHGCVRLERPFKLAEVILKNINNLNEDTVKNIIRNKEPQRIFLKAPVNVFFTYQTAWVENGELHFRKDVYAIDDKQISINKTFFIPKGNIEHSKTILSSTEKRKNNQELSYDNLNTKHLD